MSSICCGEKKLSRDWVGGGEMGSGLKCFLNPEAHIRSDIWEGREGAIWASGGRMCQAEGTESAKALRWIVLTEASVAAVQ